MNKDKFGQEILLNSTVLFVDRQKSRMIEGKVLSLADEDSIYIDITYMAPDTSGTGAKLPRLINKFAQIKPEETINMSNFREAMPELFI